MYSLDQVSVPSTGDGTWNEEGVVILRDFMPEELMSKYEKAWLRDNSERPGGWLDPCPYMRVKEIRDLFLYQPLCDEIESLIGEPPGLHLNLTGWISTSRNWHQDTYLNPPHVGDAYAAVWIALDTIHPDSGPFQYIPGSQFWPTIVQEKVRALIPKEKNDHRWPKFSEEILNPILDEKIRQEGIEPVSYLPNRGDVLIWNGRLLHRGSEPNVPGMERRATIGHYSGIHHRPDMPKPKKARLAGHYFPIETDVELYYG
jgi:hypothetical protein